MIRLSTEAQRQFESIKADVGRIGTSFTASSASEVCLASAEKMLAGLEKKARTLRAQINRERPTDRAAA